MEKVKDKKLKQDFSYEFDRPYWTELELTEKDIQEIKVQIECMSEYVRKYDKKFFARFSEDEKKEMIFRNPVIITYEYEVIYDERTKNEMEKEFEYRKGNLVMAEHSVDINPSYYEEGKDHEFDLSTFFVTCEYEGIVKQVVVKERPSVGDLEKDNRIKLYDKLIQ